MGRNEKRFIMQPFPKPHRAQGARTMSQCFGTTILHAIYMPACYRKEQALA